MSKIDLRLVQHALKYHLESAQSFFASASQEAQRTPADVEKALELIEFAHLNIDTFIEIAKMLQKVEGVAQPHDVWRLVNESHTQILQQHRHIFEMFLLVHTGKAPKPPAKCTTVH